MSFIARSLAPACFLLGLSLLGRPAPCRGQEEGDFSAQQLDSVLVTASRADEGTPVAYSTVGRAQLRASDGTRSLPMDLSLLPSAVAYNEGGTGLGNSALSIRGVRGSQMNVTLNGIPLNDAESQEVFWVNIPAFPAFLSQVQVQRGVGTATHGAGAFGAGIHLGTHAVDSLPWARADFSAGAFHTTTALASAGSGPLAGGRFQVTGAVSWNQTDGYVRNAAVRSQSAFLSAFWRGRRQSVRLTALAGAQRSGITWDGVALPAFLRGDVRQNEAGAFHDSLGNVLYYGNQTDNYRQRHIQITHTLSPGGGFTWSNTFHYTRGSGYDEYYMEAQSLPDYGLSVPEGGTFPATDLVCRKQMANDFFDLHSLLAYRRAALSLQGGVNWSHYGGDHWGEVLWVQRPLPDGAKASDLPWYGNRARKRDLSVFARAQCSLSPAWLLYAELQYRRVGYSIAGPDEDWRARGALPQDEMHYDKVWHFFNPRAGVSFAPHGGHRIFCSVAQGHREPSRGDIKENIKGTAQPIRPEAMVDAEIGYGFASARFQGQLNVYWMAYRQLLLETGRLSASGYAIKENAGRGFRRGVEVEACTKPWDFLALEGNVTLSQSRLKTSDSDSFFPMLLSPACVGMVRLTLCPFLGWEAPRSLRPLALSFSAKHVGRQYMDNSGREAVAVPAYTVASLSLTHQLRWGRERRLLEWGIFVENLFNRRYYASGWCWDWTDTASGETVTEVYVYPQAPLHCMVKLAFSL